MTKSGGLLFQNKSLKRHTTNCLACSLVKILIEPLQMTLWAQLQNLNTHWSFDNIKGFTLLTVTMA